MYQIAKYLTPAQRERIRTVVPEMWADCPWPRPHVCPLNYAIGRDGSANDISENWLAILVAQNPGVDAETIRKVGFRFISKVADVPHTPWSAVLRALGCTRPFSRKRMSS